MKKKLKIAALVLLTAVCFAIFAGCKTDYAAIYNDDEKIIKGSVYSSVGALEVNKLGSYSYECKKFSGVKEVVSSFLVSSVTTANLTLNVEEGDFKLVLTSDDTVYVLKEGSYEGVLTFEDIPDGVYDLKMVGVGAKVELDFEY